MVTWGSAGRALSSMVSVRLADNIFLNSALSSDPVYSRLKGRII
jgi:hypothetical protein